MESVSRLSINLHKIEIQINRKLIYEIYDKKLKIDKLKENQRGKKGMSI